MEDPQKFIQADRSETNFNTGDDKHFFVLYEQIKLL